MNTDAVDPIVKAVLYEGHILYPYRPSSIKNRKRFTFGRVYPRTYSRLQNGREPWTMTTECLLQVGTSGVVDSLETPGPDAGDVATIEVGVHFLQPVDRQIIDKTGCEVDRLVVNGEMHQSWMDVIERSVEMPPLQASAGRRCVKAFAFSASSGRDAIRANGGLAGYVERRHPRLAGSVEFSIEPVVGSVHRVRATVSNESMLPENLARCHDEVLLRTFASTHTILQVKGARFFSMTDPPQEYAEAAEACENSGTWPVLVGEEGQQDTVLSSPIILYDYPRIAQESAGDFFDGTEIDEMLTLRVMTLSDEEKMEIRGSDELARRILHRTEHLDDEDLFGMHGTVRGLKQLSHQVPPKHVDVGGRRLTVGDRVRIRPMKMTDVMDVALAGKTAEIESIEQDFEGKIHLALVVDDDPGRDLGLLRQPGHRFFYGLDDVELLEKGDQ